MEENVPNIIPLKPTNKWLGLKNKKLSTTNKKKVWIGINKIIR